MPSTAPFNAKRRGWLPAALQNFDKDHRDDEFSARAPRARKASRRPDATVPAPTGTMLRLLDLLRRPVPAGELRPAASAAGMSAGEIDAAVGVATRRQAIRMVLVGGAAHYARVRP